MSKLLFVTTSAVSINTFLIPRIEKLITLGYEIDLICSEADKLKINSCWKEIRCYNVNFARKPGIANIVTSCITLFRIIERKHYDYIHFSTPTASFCSSIVCFMLGYRSELHYGQWGIHYVNATGSRYFLHHQVESITCRLSAVVYGVSESNVLLARKLNLVNGGKIKKVGIGGVLGVDDKIFANFSYSELPDVVRIGCVGRICRDKGIGDIIALSKKTNHAVEIYLYGEIEDMDLLSELKTQSNIYLCGHVEDKERIFNSFDILVHPTRREGFSMVIQEAIYAKKHVIATNVNGPKDVLLNGELGMLYQPGDIDDLERLLDGLISGHQKDLRLEAFCFASKHYSREHVLGAWIAETIKRIKQTTNGN